MTHSEAMELYKDELEELVDDYVTPTNTAIFLMTIGTIAAIVYWVGASWLFGVLYVVLLASAAFSGLVFTAYRSVNQEFIDSINAANEERDEALAFAANTREEADKMKLAFDEQWDGLVKDNTKLAALAKSYKEKGLALQANLDEALEARNIEHELDAIQRYQDLRSAIAQLKQPNLSTEKEDHAKEVVSSFFAEYPALIDLLPEKVTEKYPELVPAS